MNIPEEAQLVQRLAEAQVLSKLPEADRMELAHLARRRRLRPGQILVRQGEFWTNVLLLNFGTVRAVISSATG